MKRQICMLLSLGLLLAACAGCGEPGGDGQRDPEEPIANLYYDITGIPPQETVISVAGNEVPAELYFYWLAYNAATTEQQIRTYAMYGMYADMFDEDGGLVWDAELTEGQTLRQYVEGTTEHTAIFYAALENLAARSGATLTEEDLADMAADMDAILEQAGGEEQFQAQLDQMGITRETYERIDSAYYLFSHLTELAQQEDSALYLESEGYDRYGTFADHILLATIDLETNEPLGEEEIAAKRATAEDLLAQLQAAEDVETLFTQLADQYSEDTGRLSNPDGYIYTPGTMVAEFEDAAAALAPGEFSGIVETSYGYHIILRKDLAKGLAAHPDQKAALVEAYIDELIESASEEDVVRSEKLDAIDTATFYTAYQEALEAMTGGTETDDETQADGGLVTQ